LARIHWASPGEERAAVAYFKRHPDQTYSFVDCLSFVVMEKLELISRAHVGCAVDAGISEATPDAENSPRRTACEHMIADLRNVFRGMRATDSSSSATKTKNLGVTFW